MKWAGVFAIIGLIGILAMGWLRASGGSVTPPGGYVPARPDLCILHTCTPTPVVPTETATPAATTVQVQAPSCQSKCMKTDTDLTCQINAGTTCVLLEMQEGWSSPRPLTVTFTTAFTYTAQLVR